MEPTRKPRVKICCMGSVQEARLAITYGASAVGLVSAMPSGPGVIAEDMIAHIAATIPPVVTSVMLTSRQDVVSIIEQQRRCRVNALQIVDHLLEGTYQELRDALPGIDIIQVIHIGDEAAIDEALAVAPHVNALLLDSGNQALAIKELGGTGRVHNWDISREIRERAPVPVFLAGGLRPDNIVAAIEQVRPFGVDVCSGVRTDGRLDEGKLARFFASIATIA